jgi:hypothetical protein
MKLCVGISEDEIKQAVKEFIERRYAVEIGGEGTLVIEVKSCQMFEVNNGRTELVGSFTLSKAALEVMKQKFKTAEFVEVS